MRSVLSRPCASVARERPAAKREAERAGFEPATHLSARTRFPVALLRPLGHLSAGRSGLSRTKFEPGERWNLAGLLGISDLIRLRGRIGLRPSRLGVAVRGPGEGVLQREQRDRSSPTLISHHLRDRDSRARRASRVQVSDYDRRRALDASLREALSGFRSVAGMQDTNPIRAETMLSATSARSSRSANRRSA
jgi:hypothetical protein